MALSKYNKTVYVNNSTPYLSADNLNNTEDGIEAVTNEVIKQSEEIETKADKTDIPDLTDYAKKSDIPDVSIFATTSDLKTKLDATTYEAGVESLEKEIALKASKTELETGLGLKVDKTTYASDLATTEKEIALKANKTDIPDVSNFATKTELNNGLATKADINSLPDMTLYETKTELETTLKSYAKTTDIPTDFYTKAETDAAIQSAIDGLSKANGVSF